MKKRLLFVIRDFKQGGVPRCLQSLLQHLDKDQYDVKVYCMHHDGPYKGNMPNCEVLPEDKVIRSLLTYRSQASISSKLLKVVRTIGRKIFHWDLLDWRFKKVAKTIKCDIAIAYAEGFPARFVSNVKSQKKLVWIHNDYQWIPQSGSDTDFSIFDNIVCVSECTRQSFNQVYSRYADKTITIHNVMNIDYMEELASVKITDLIFNTDKLTIVSLGRVCYQKNFDVIPQIASKLKMETDFYWYIIGSGPDDEVNSVKNKMSEYGVEDNVIMLGAKDNPYKYLAKADVFALTSRYESYPTVINEALILDIPVVSNNIPSAREMISSGNGIITDYEHFADAIIEASKLKPCFVSENEEILKKLDELFRK